MNDLRLILFNLIVDGLSSSGEENQEYPIGNPSSDNPAEELIKEKGNNKEKSSHTKHSSKNEVNEDSENEDEDNDSPEDSDDSYFANEKKSASEGSFVAG